jgi:dihydroneopterin aldolase
MRGASRLTLEFLAQEIAAGLVRLDRVLAARVRVTKLSPPLVPGATSAAEIEMERR